MDDVNTNRRILRKSAEAWGAQADDVASPDEAMALLREGRRYDAAILLVDDNAMNRKLGVKVLRRLGYDPDVAEDGFKALAACAAKPYDLVLMDIEMPGLNGIDTTTRIRAELPAPHPFVVALTANAMTGDRERYIASGMDDYLSKPLRVESLVEAMSRAAGRIRPTA